MSLAEQLRESAEKSPVARDLKKEAAAELERLTERVKEAEETVEAFREALKALVSEETFERFAAVFLAADEASS